MYNNVYQEYIDNILGTNPNYNRIEPANFENSINTNQFFQNLVNNESLEKLYPDLYKLLYPMIQHACIKNTNQLSENTINDMVEEIYSNFVSDNNRIDNFNSNSNIELRSGKSSETVYVSKAKSSTSITAKKEERISEKRENRQDNYVLRDLIRILVLRELLERPRGNRPSWQDPSFKAPFRSRDFSLNNGIYEMEPNIYSNFDY